VAPEFTSTELHMLTNSEPSRSELDDILEDLQRITQRRIAQLQQEYMTLLLANEALIEPNMEQLRKNYSLSKKEAFELAYDCFRKFIEERRVLLREAIRAEHYRQDHFVADARMYVDGKNRDEPKKAA